MPHHGRHFASSWYSALREVCEQFGRWDHDYLAGSTWFWILHHHLHEYITTTENYHKYLYLFTSFTSWSILANNDNWTLQIAGCFFPLAPHTREISRRATSPSKVNIWPCPLQIPDAALVHISCQGPGASIPGEKHRKKKQRLSLGRMFIPYHQCEESVYHQCIAKNLSQITHNGMWFPNCHRTVHQAGYQTWKIVTIKWYKRIPAVCQTLAEILEFKVSISISKDSKVRTHGIQLSILVLSATSTCHLLSCVKPARYLIISRSKMLYRPHHMACHHCDHIRDQSLPPIFHWPRPTHSSACFENMFWTKLELPEVAGIQEDYEYMLWWYITYSIIHRFLLFVRIYATNRIRTRKYPQYVHMNYMCIYIYVCMYLYIQ